MAEGLRPQHPRARLHGRGGLGEKSRRGSRRAEPVPRPIRFISAARGSRIRDRDGNEYIDFMIGAGSLIHGHAHPAIMGIE